MKIGILGGGRVGAALAQTWREAGHTVTISTRETSPASLVYCGDDEEATAVAATLIEDLGFEPVDVGGSEQTAAVESFAKLVIGTAYRQGRGPFVYRFESA